MLPLLKAGFDRVKLIQNFCKREMNWCSFASRAFNKFLSRGCIAKVDV